MNPILKVEQVSLSFGGLKALDSVSWSLQPGQILGLIGPNGAGKTTLFNIITGLYRPDQGQVSLAGQAIAGLSPQEILKKGLTRTFQNLRLFSQLTVEENICLGASLEVERFGFWDFFLASGSWRLAEEEVREKAWQLMSRFQLLPLREKIASDLSYGQRRRVEIARALMSNPKVLCLDEPAAGLNPAETEELRRWLSDLQKDFGLSLVVIEHDMHLVMNLCDWVVVLDHGNKIAEGPPLEVKKNPEVIKAYLGEEYVTS